MKKHSLVLAFVAFLLIGIYIVGHPKTVNAPVSPQPSFNKSSYSLIDPSSKWVVVNKSRPLKPLDYAPTDVVVVGNAQLLRQEAADSLKIMLSDARKAGLALTPESGYRSYATQNGAYTSEVNAYGKAVADRESARPGYSEHQTGWAIDLGSNGCDVQDCFSATPAGKWAIANAYKYGFLLRYPANKVNITGYRNEAWHFRYVGRPLAIEMHREHILTLEEFFGLPAAPDYK